jgi:predicted nucleic acid-binding protein
VIVVADASPLHYLILIEHVHVLPALYGRVVIPPAVITELTRSDTPDSVRSWLSNKPSWCKVQGPSQLLTSLPRTLGPGEREALALAAELSADALLMDDRDGRREAEKLHLAVLGTLRVLADAAQHGFADLPTALIRLRLTNFRASDELLRRILEQDAKRRET